MEIFTAPPESALVEKFSVISVLKPVGQFGGGGYCTRGLEAIYIPRKCSGFLKAKE